MLKACIQIFSNGQETWVPIPNEDLDTAISDFVGDKKWECIGAISINFNTNNFSKCNIFELNNLIIHLEKLGFSTNSIEHLATLNLLLEDRNYNCEEVKNIYENGNFKVYSNVYDIGEVAKKYLENCSEWYRNAKENECYFDNYFDFKSYGEEILEPNGNWLQDKYNKIIVEVFQ